MSDSEISKKPVYERGDRLRALAEEGGLRRASPDFLELIGAHVINEYPSLNSKVFRGVVNQKDDGLKAVFNFHGLEEQSKPMDVVRRVQHEVALQKQGVPTAAPMRADLIALHVLAALGRHQYRNMPGPSV
jgi:hypothetical protein